MTEGEIRQNAQLMALVAEMYAINAWVEGMKAANIGNQNSATYDEGAFADASSDLAGLAEKMREEI